jgi:hypothetical protein
MWHSATSTREAAAPVLVSNADLNNDGDEDLFIVGGPPPSAPAGPPEGPVGSYWSPPNSL